ncbi:MAG: low-complexity tail membrane protein [Cyanobacteriota bacterium]|nr:low-complexity tail membrane protein [Cyanobacteriota bacterium]
MSFRWEPFLWIHLTGLLVLPLWLEGVWLGVALAGELLPLGAEFALIAVAGIVPVLWMQLRRPFDIFSLLLVAIAPQQLNPQQRRLLALFKTPTNRLLSLLAAVVLLGVLWEVFQLAPLAATAAAVLPQWRLLGLLLAMLSFGASNLFLQVPVSVAGVLLQSDRVFEATQPLEVEEIARDFTIAGFRVRRILPWIGD